GRDVSEDGATLDAIPSTYQALSEKDAADGYAGLDESGLLDGEAIPYGTEANTACEGNDSRLSNARTPTAHGHAIDDVSGLQTALNGKVPIGRILTTTSP